MKRTKALFDEQGKRTARAEKIARRFSRVLAPILRAEAKRGHNAVTDMWFLLEAVLHDEAQVVHDRVDRRAEHVRQLTTPCQGDGS